MFIGIILALLAGFSTALINNVFILYHLKLYTSVYKVSDAWLYAASVAERFDPDRVERHDHETAYENLANADY